MIFAVSGASCQESNVVESCIITRPTFGCKNMACVNCGQKWITPSSPGGQQVLRIQSFTNGSPSSAWLPRTGFCSIFSVCFIPSRFGSALGFEKQGGLAAAEGIFDPISGSPLEEVFGPVLTDVRKRGTNVAKNAK